MKKIRLFVVGCITLTLLSLVTGAALFERPALFSTSANQSSDELPEGTVMQIFDTISSTSTPEELIERTYDKDMLLHLGINEVGEIENLNYAARSLTAIDARYPMECVRRINDELIYTVYRIEDNKKTFNCYLFFERLSPIEATMGEDMEIWWLTGRALFSCKSLSYSDFASISKGASVFDVANIDPMTVEYMPKEPETITVQDFDFDTNEYVERSYTTDPVLEYKDYHLLSDGILCIMYSRDDANAIFTVDAVGFNPTYEIESDYANDAIALEVAPIDLPA